LPSAFAAIEDSCGFTWWRPSIHGQLGDSLAFRAGKRVGIWPDGQSDQTRGGSAGMVCRVGFGRGIVSLRSPTTRPESGSGDRHLQTHPSMINLAYE
jgi:hypothetical protein